MIRGSHNCGLCEGNYIAWGRCDNKCDRTDTSIIAVSNHESYCFCPYHADLFLHPPSPTISQVMDALDDMDNDPPPEPVE